MRSASAIRIQVESALAKRIPAALTPAQRQVRPMRPTGIANVDDLIGGFPEGAITELTGPECSGRTSLALAFAASVTRLGGVCAWIDASDTLHGESAAVAGVSLARLLWVRCGVSEGANGARGYSFTLPRQYLAPKPIKRGLHGGGHGPHPRTETRGLSKAMGQLFAQTPSVDSAPRQGEFQAQSEVLSRTFKRAGQDKPWTRIEQALKATDLLLNAGGFAAVILDLGSVAPEHVSRVELSVWFRYRAAVERSQASLVMLTKHPSAKSAGELLLRLRPGSAHHDVPTVFTGVTHTLEVERRRFADNVISMKKPPKSAHAVWTTQSSWAVEI